MVTINLIAIAFAAMSVGQFMCLKIATDPSKARMWQRVFAVFCSLLGCAGAATAAIISWSGGQWVGMVAP